MSRFIITSEMSAPLTTPLEVPSANPRANYLAHRQEIDEAVQRVLENGRYILGDEVRQFESEFARYVGVRGAVGVASGTDAVQLALRACGIGLGDPVITVSHTAVATVAAIQSCGALPVLIDVDSDTFTIDAARLEVVLDAWQFATPPKAVVPVHLYGHPANMAEVLVVARKHGLFVVEDCSQAHGATANGRTVGSMGHMGAFSFYPTKNLGAFGDGGAVVSDDPALLERAELLRQYGWRERYISEVPGMNTRLDELQAAILRVKLRYLAAENARRQRIAQFYSSGLSASDLRLPVTAAWAKHVFHQYVVRSPDRDGLARYLKSKGVGTSVLYPVPVHLQPAYRRRIPIDPSGLPKTEMLCQEILSLPLFPEMSDEQTTWVLEVARTWSKDPSP